MPIEVNAPEMIFNTCLIFQDIFWTSIPSGNSIQAITPFASELRTSPIFLQEFIPLSTKLTSFPLIKPQIPFGIAVMPIEPNTLETAVKTVQILLVIEFLSFISKFKFLVRFEKWIIPSVISINAFPDAFTASAPCSALFFPRPNVSVLNIPVNTPPIPPLKATDANAAVIPVITFEISFNFSTAVDQFKTFIDSFKFLENDTNECPTVYKVSAAGISKIEYKPSGAKDIINPSIATPKEIILLFDFSSGHFISAKTLIPLAAIKIEVDIKTSAAPAATTPAQETTAVNAAIATIIPKNANTIPTPIAALFNSKFLVAW